jgi:hypothetical protein
MFLHLTMKLTKLIPAILLLACSASRLDDISQESGPLPPKDFHCEVGEGGGFTGLWNGYDVDSTGNVLSLSGRRPNELRTHRGSLSEGPFKALWRHIVESGVLTNPYTSSTGNMTRSLVVSANGRTVRLTWVEGEERYRSLDQLYGRLMQLFGSQFPRQ